MSSNIEPSSSNKLFLHNKILEGYGCKNCVWKTYDQCPHNLKEEDIYQDGYCEEFASFILSLAEKEDSISAVKEKFMLYVQEMQAIGDHREFHKVLKEYNELKENESSYTNKEEYNKKLGNLHMTVVSYKIWWSRLTELVVKGLSRIVDRERRSKDVKSSSKITVQQLNVLLKESDKKLKEVE